MVDFSHLNHLRLDDSNPFVEPSSGGGNYMKEIVKSINKNDMLENDSSLSR